MDKAIRMLEKYKEKAGFKTKGEAYRLLGRAYLQRNKLQKALSCFERVGYLEKPTWETFLNKGVAYFGLDQLEKARESFERAKELKPDEIKVIYNLAITDEKLRLFEQAKDLFRQVANMEPKTSEEKKARKKAR